LQSTTNRPYARGRRDRALARPQSRQPHRRRGGGGEPWLPARSTAAAAARGPILDLVLRANATAVRLPAGFAGLGAPERWPPPRSRPAALDRPLDTLPGVGKTLRGRLAKLGLRTVRDLVEHAPFRYVGARPIAQLTEDGAEVAVEGVVGRVASRRPRRRLSIVEATVTDESGSVRASWFNQPWVADQLHRGMRVRLIGTLRRGGFAVRAHEPVEGPADLVPVYPSGEDVTPKKLRELIGAALPRDVADPLPARLRADDGLPLRADALHVLHRPRSPQEAERGRRRLAFDELLVLQLGLARAARAREAAVAASLGAPGELVRRYRAALPFALTEHQERAIAEIDADLARTVPMQRLLQGDVGSGKTVVALYALLRAVENGRQGALMAPTETLAEQHYLTLEPLCAPLGVRVALLTGSVRSDASVDVLVGTHALIQAGVELPRLAVAVVDEQHRFGVEQRRALVEGGAPHVLHMTATPIPRTLALTVYGDLAVSEIAKPPAARKPVITRWVTAERSSEAYRRLRRHLDDGRQAYVVCPLIEESEVSVARAAEAEADRLRHGELRGYRVGLLHGRLRAVERRELMAAFKARELDVLVATTVIEVGVDVPNATIMIVQEADRFGLATLHQLRGRVGRGAEQSYCLLVSRPHDELTETAKERLEALVATTDGFELAERDLAIRGEGHLLGIRQSGLSDLKFTRLRADRPLLAPARAAAQALVDDHGPLDDEVARRLGDAGVAA
jgi:ATP-dependent DNA helicase RecG